MKTAKISKIARYTLSAATLLVFGLMLSSANAGEDGSAFGSTLKFSAGIVSGFLIHEASHEVAARLTNTDMHWERGTLLQPMSFSHSADTNWKGFVINSAGFISQAAGAEIILQCDKIDKNDAYVRGMMAWNILNPIFYSLDY